MADIARSCVSGDSDDPDFTVQVEMTALRTFRASPKVLASSPDLWIASQIKMEKRDVF
jgi:hypothetical protein